MEKNILNANSDLIYKLKNLSKLNNIKQIGGSTSTPIDKPKLAARELENQKLASEGLIDRVRLLKEKNKEYIAEIDKVEKQNDELKDTNKRLKDNNDELEKQNEKLESQIFQLEKQNEKLEKQNEENNSDTEFTEDIHDLNITINKSIKKLEENNYDTKFTEDIQDLNIKYDKSIEELKELRKKLKEEDQALKEEDYRLDKLELNNVNIELIKQRLKNKKLLKALILLLEENIKNISKINKIKKALPIGVFI